MLLKYSSNIAKSIFGIRNPKIIATLVYANSVLSNYNKNISTISNNFKEVSKVIENCVEKIKEESEFSKKEKEIELLLKNKKINIINCSIKQLKNKKYIA